MQTQNRFFEDLSKMANGAAGTFAGAAREFESMIRQGVDRFMAGQNFVSRDEFEAVKALAAAAREEAEALRARVAALEAGPPVKPASRRKPTA